MSVRSRLINFDAGRTTRLPEETTPATPEFERKRAAWEATDAEFKRLMDTRDNMLLALNMASVPEQHPDAVGLMERAGKYLERARRYPKRILEDVEDINQEIDRERPGHKLAREQWEIDRVAETDRIAEQLIPRHRAAVERTARALEVLSQALFDELEVRAELEQTAPLPRSRHLPNMSSAFAICRLNEPNSTASAWAGIARELLDE
jgi:hypothetical protein